MNGLGRGATAFATADAFARRVRQRETAEARSRTAAADCEARAKSADGPNKGAPGSSCNGLEKPVERERERTKAKDCGETGARERARLLEFPLSFSQVPGAVQPFALHRHHMA